MYFRINLIWGRVVLGINNIGEIFGLWFVEQKYFPEIEGEPIIDVEDKTNEEYLNFTNNIMNKSIDKAVDETLGETIKQLREYENGIRKSFDLPLAPNGTDFRIKVWEVLKTIEYGQTTTYGAIGKVVAKSMNKETMSGQAVGGAVGHNPISIIIPCHRVVGSDGSLTGYAGGIDKKQALLFHETK